MNTSKKIFGYRIEDSKGRKPLSSFPMRAEGELIETTEPQSSKRKSSTFMRKRDRKTARMILPFRQSFLYHCHIIPRLRHGLLSLCSVVSFRQKEMRKSVIIICQSYIFIKFIWIIHWNKLILHRTITVTGINYLIARPSFSNATYV